MIYIIPSLTLAFDPLTADGPDGRPTQAPLTWWQTAYPDTWRALLAAGGYALGVDDDPAPYGLGEPTIEADADGLPIVRRAALPEPVDTRTPEERLAEERATLTCTPYQGELVLAQHGLRPAWLALMVGLTDADQVRYLRAPLWHRSDPLIDAAMAALRPDLTAAEQAALADALFREARAVAAAAR